MWELKDALAEAMAYIGLEKRGDQVTEAPGAQRRVLEFCIFVSRESWAQGFGLLKTS